MLKVYENIEMQSQSISNNKCLLLILVYINIYIYITGIDRNFGYDGIA